MTFLPSVGGYMQDHKRSGTIACLVMISVPVSRKIVGHASGLRSMAASDSIRLMFLQTRQAAFDAQFACELHSRLRMVRKRSACPLTSPLDPCRQFSGRERAPCRGCGVRVLQLEWFPKRSQMVGHRQIHPRCAIRWVQRRCDARKDLTWTKGIYQLDARDPATFR